MARFPRTEPEVIKVTVTRNIFPGDKQTVRRGTVITALNMLRKKLT